MAGGFLLPVRVLVALFLVRLMALHGAGRLGFLGSIAHLAERPALLRYLSAARKKRWAVHAQPRFADPEAMLAYLSRDTHRVAIWNSCFIRFDDEGVTFRSRIRPHMRSIDQLALAVEIP